MSLLRRGAKGATTKQSATHLASEKALSGEFLEIS